jgi:hypothetical protein
MGDWGVRLLPTFRPIRNGRVNRGLGVRLLPTLRPIRDGCAIVNRCATDIAPQPGRERDDECKRYQHFVPAGTGAWLARM